MKGKRATNKRRYMPGLDGFRGLAVLAVIFYHMNFSWAAGGLLGVTVFFVLSGYLITNILLTDWETKGKIQLKRFWWRRIRRLFPAMYAMLLVVFVWITLFDRALLAPLREDFLSVIFYFSNWWFIIKDHSYFASYETPSLVGHFWSLAIEEQFYILWPILIIAMMLIFKKRGVGIFWTMLILAAISTVWMGYLYEPGADPSRVYYGTDTRAFSLLIGAALAVVWPSNKLSEKVGISQRIFLDTIGLIVLVIIGAVVFYTDQFSEFMYTGGMFLFSILVAILLAVLAHPASILAKVMSFKPLRWAGLRSYAMYLWHYPIVILIGSSYYNDGTWSWTVVLQLILIAVIAELSWRYIEEPVKNGAIENWWKRVRNKTWNFSDMIAQHAMKVVTFLTLFAIAVIGFISAPAFEVTQEEKVESIEVVADEEEKKAAEAEARRLEEEAERLRQEKESLEQRKQLAIEQLHQEQVTVIGDSVMLAAVDHLREQFPALSANVKIGRQMAAAPPIIQELANAGQLGQHVVLGLGSNGNFNTNTLKKALNALGEDRSVYLITTRIRNNWQENVNANLKSVAELYDNVEIIDWHALSADHPEWFEPDKTHLNITGAKAYTDIIVRAMEERVARQVEK